MNCLIAIMKHSHITGKRVVHKWVNCTFYSHTASSHWKGAQVKEFTGCFGFLGNDAGRLHCWLNRKALWKRVRHQSQQKLFQNSRIRQEAQWYTVTMAMMCAMSEESETLNSVLWDRIWGVGRQLQNWNTPIDPMRTDCRRDFVLAMPTFPLANLLDVYWKRIYYI